MIASTCTDCPATCTEADLRTAPDGMGGRVPFHICAACRAADGAFAAEAMIEAAFSDADAPEPVAVDNLTECAICGELETGSAMVEFFGRGICRNCQRDEDDRMQARRAEDDAAYEAQMNGFERSRANRGGYECCAGGR